MGQGLKVLFDLAMEADENVTVAKTVVEAPRPGRGASEVELHRILVVELTNRSDRDEDVWGGHGYLMPHYYRHDDDPDHVLELDPSTGRFVPQSTLRPWEDDTTVFEVPLQQDDFSHSGNKSIVDKNPANEEGSTRSLGSHSVSSASCPISWTMGQALGYDERSRKAEKKTKQPWSEESRANIIHFAPAPNENLFPKAYQEAKERIVKGAESAMAAPDIIMAEQHVDNEGEAKDYLQILFFTDGSFENKPFYEERGAKQRNHANTNSGDAHLTLEGYETITSDMREMFSIGQGELTAIPQCLTVGMEILDGLAASAQLLSEAAAATASPAPPTIPTKSRIIIYSDSMDVQRRLSVGIHRDPSNTMPPALDGIDGKANFYLEHTLPAYNCEVEVRWRPRRSTAPAAVADDLAGQWKTRAPDYWKPDGEYEQLHGQSSSLIADRLRPEVFEAAEAFQAYWAQETVQGNQNPWPASRSSKRRANKDRTNQKKTSDDRRKSKVDWRRRNNAKF
ncbi:hypothetical protein QBC37DRAFT_370632 [Rhypophila decipiens]|uniref:Uncharacterized protein n=1 Tax=Rhypophila decipiens TaxID=261697 RepID=A0AAN7BD94_9PEZI|nr:hypothetical protein QBC37DRAFT_370632 [Rhypophila decipiens]